MVTLQEQANNFYKAVINLFYLLVEALYIVKIKSWLTSKLNNTK